MAYTRLEDRQVDYCNSIDENEKIMRAHRHREQKIREELGMESQYNDEADYDPRYVTRMELSRILETDEDNLY